jgi:branched-chain amino acid transport system substrate-binding protein
MQMNKRILTGMLLAVLAFAACEGKKSGPAAEASRPEDMPPFRIAVVDPLTGSDPFGGAEYKNGAEMAVEHLGGVINGRKFEVIVADAPNQDAHISEFERLYNQGVRCFYSGYGSIADRTFATMVDEMEAMYLSLAWDTSLLQGESDYFTRVSPRLDYYSQGLLHFCVDVGEKYLGIPAKDLKIAVVGNTRVEYIELPFEEEAKKLGIKIVLKESYPIDTKDFVPIVTKLMNTDYDILVPFQVSVDGFPFQKKMYEMGYRPKVVIGAGVLYDTPVFADLGNDITDGTLTISYITPTIKDEAAKGIKRFREDYEKKFGYKPLSHALLSYGAVMLYSEVLSRVDPSRWEDTKLLVDTLRGMEFDYGETVWYYGLKIEGNDNVRADRFLLNQWVGGELQCVYPPDLAIAEPKIPWK